MDEIDFHTGLTMLNGVKTPYAELMAESREAVWIIRILPDSTTIRTRNHRVVDSFPKTKFTKLIESAYEQTYDLIVDYLNAPTNEKWWTIKEIARGGATGHELASGAAESVAERRMTEDDIMYENGNYWVYRDRNAYTVYKTGFTHSTADSSYAKTPDGLSVAIARCDYLARREEEKSARGVRDRSAVIGERSKVESDFEEQEFFQGPGTGDAKIATVGFVELDPSGVEIVSIDVDTEEGPDKTGYYPTGVYDDVLDVKRELRRFSGAQFKNVDRAMEAIRRTLMSMGAS